MNESSNNQVNTSFGSSANSDMLNLCQTIASSFTKLTGRVLVSPSDDPRIVADQLFQHNSVILAHNTADDPVFVFANRTAMRLWEYAWDEIIGLPSRFTAEPDLRPDRHLLLEQVRKFGFIDNYSGVRVSKSGKRFLIERATVWNVVDDAGVRIGQAATFDHWSQLEETQR